MDEKELPKPVTDPVELLRKIQCATTEGELARLGAIFYGQIYGEGITYTHPDLGNKLMYFQRTVRGLRHELTL